MATLAKEEDTCPKVLIRGELRKVPGSFPKEASSRLELDQQFINELTKQLVVDWREGRQLNTSPSAKAKSSSRTTNLIYKCAFCNYL